jgi:outer membrane protein assembly factor BamA
VNVRITASADGAGRDVIFVVDEGPRQVIADIRISGNRRIDLDVISSALQLSPGQPLRADEVLQARRHLFDTGLFRRVDITTESASSARDLGGTPMAINVSIEEWPVLRLRYGFQAAEQRPAGDLTGRNLVPGLSADVTRRTLFGRPIATGAAASYQPRDRMARVFLNAPTFLSLPVESSLTVERSRREFADATLVSDIVGLSWEQRTRVAKHLQLSYAYRFDRDHTFDTEGKAAAEFTFDITVNVARLTGGAAWDTRNDPADPARGLLLSSTVEWGPEAAGSDFRFIRHLAQAYRFTPWRRLVFASAARVGTVTPLGGQELIPSIRFFAGGSRSVRGVAEEGLGERDFLGEPRGGGALLLLNQEVRFPVYGWVKGVAFVDAGNVFPGANDLSVRNLTTSTGVGVRLATPFAMLRADYGRVLKTGEVRWTFGIGQAF